MQDRGPEIAAVCISFIIATWLFVSMRLFVRGFMIKALGLDDWLMVTTLVLFTLSNASILAGVSHGFGKHEASLSAKRVTAALEAWWFSEFTYILDTCSLKIAIGAFLLRVTNTTRHRYIIYGVAALSTVYSVYAIFLIIFQCLPVSYFWNKAQRGHCIAPAVVTGSTYAYSAISAISDWTLGILPIFIIRDLQMKRVVKISVAVLLCFANIGSIATLLRFQYIKQLNGTSDFLYNTANISIWSTVEPGVGIIAGSIATYRPLFRIIFSKMGSAFGTPRTALVVGPSHFGYKRTSPARDETPSESNLTSHGASVSKEAKSWDSGDQQYEMDENIGRAKTSTRISSSEIHAL